MLSVGVWDPSSFTCLDVIWLNGLAQLGSAYGCWIANLCFCVVQISSWLTDCLSADWTLQTEAQQLDRWQWPGPRKCFCCPCSVRVASFVSSQYVSMQSLKLKMWTDFSWSIRLVIHLYLYIIEGSPRPRIIWSSISVMCFSLQKTEVKCLCFVLVRESNKLLCTDTALH